MGHLLGIDHRRDRIKSRKPVFMKQLIELSDGWELTSAAAAPASSLQQTYVASGPDPEPWIATEMPRQVHEVLLEAAVISNPYSLGGARACEWVAERDWIYRTTFAYSGEGTTAFLHFDGLDTIVDIYLNGEFVGSHRDMFIPLRLDVTGMLRENNDLVLYFSSPHEFLRNVTLPDEWRGRVRPNKLLRKPFNDFTDYLGPKPYLTPIGVYGAVTLELVDRAEILDLDIRSTVVPTLDAARIDVAVEVVGEDGAEVRVLVRDESGAVVRDKTLPVDAGTARASIDLNSPALWWPKGHGAQSMHTIEATLLVAGEECDRFVKAIGLRRVEMPQPFEFIVNGRPITLWGAQPAPLTGITHRWDRDKAIAVLDRLEECNMNAVRLWGASERWEDEFYEETDRRGLLVWQEFFHDIGMYPDTAEYRTLCKSEAEFQVRRLKHHPSLLFWCGGNESFMGGEYEFPGERYIGGEIFLEDYPEVCARLDPDRYYHLSSPSGGDFANDPRGGDTHSYTNMWFVPGAEFPVMVAEEIRASPPAVKSMVRYLEDSDPWPADYDGLVAYDSGYPWPSTWTERTSTEGWKKIPEIELFHDPTDLDSGVYRFGAAHAHYMKRILESNRRGKPWWSPGGERINRGHFVCRWNDSWPIIYGSMLDFYGEPYQPYFAVKRAYAPILVSLDVADFITAWVVNDSAQAVTGTLEVRLFDPNANEFTHALTRDVSVQAGESQLVTNLNEFKQFRRDRFLLAELRDSESRVIARTNTFVDIERHLRFPDARLSVAVDGDTVTITTDRFARCVELGGSAGGDEFGWIFEDNYFDLFPGEVKTVRVSGRHGNGKITAKPHFSSVATSVEFATVAQ